MLDPISRWIPIVVACASASLVACGSSGGGGDGGFDHQTSSSSSTQSAMNGGGGAGGGPILAGSGGKNEGGSGGNTGDKLEVTPKTLQTITVKSAQQTPTVTYAATLNGHPVNAGWTVDRGDIGKMPTAAASSADFTPSGNVGGYVTVSAGLTEGSQTMTVTRQILVKLTASENGPSGSAAETKQIATAVGDLTAGGGIGGVGGEGLGVAVMDQATLTALDNPTDDGSALGLKMLYPYDKTVFPRGMLAPNLMWDWSTGDADAIKIKLATKSGSYTYTGTYGRPSILTQTGGKFIRMPIPEDAWDQATNSAGGTLPDASADTLSLELTVLKDGVAHGPFKQTWTIAPARLSGIVYYNSYGTQLAKNLTGAVGGDGKFGGAVLSIHVGDTGPALAAGGNGDSSACRVCHSVSADGSRLIAQWGNGSQPSSDYDITPGGITEHLLTNKTEFPAIYPDGSMELAADGNLYPLPDNTTAIATPAANGLSAVASNIGSPAFSPDGKQVAMNPMTGSNQTLAVMQFDKATSTFSGLTVVVDDSAQPAETRPGWPAFFPDGKSIVFHHQSKAGVDGNGLGNMNTRKNAKAQIAWTSTADKDHVTPLNALNGFEDDGTTSYLPKLTAAIPLKKVGGGTCTPGSNCCTGDGAVVDNTNPTHDDDVDLNYEPTVNPVASGGYAWVVFTSRRMYGSVADIPPFCSDPRGVDLIQNTTPKKLWVAAIDLSGTPGKDASHPAFYLPAQELLAGNSRGFWVLDPCKSDGSSCESGDQCCNGFCEPNGSGDLVCSNMPNNGSCSGTAEKCDKTSDCCKSTDKCINGFCSQSIPH